MNEQSRYVVPSFTERTSYGTTSKDPYTKMFEDRIIFPASRWTTPPPTT
jgi:ATP-dependent Clp protease protease subunit